MEKNAKKIQRTCQDFVSRLGMDLKLELKSENGLFLLNLEASSSEKDAPLLIGSRGETLVALQYLLRLIINKNLKSPIKLIVDVNGYKQKQRISLDQLAKRISLKVKKTGRLEILRPMTAFERRIIHLALSEAEGVSTQSVGEEPNRRVMIRPEE